jgi:ferredoxin
MSTPQSMQRTLSKTGAVRLRIDPVACDGVGICAHLAADLLTVDSWGYPILPTDPLSRRELRAAKGAVAACPRRALFLDGD